MTHFLVVMGYGVVLDSPLGKMYLPRIKRFIDKVEPNVIIVCGGRTQEITSRKLYKGRVVSEAEVMADWFRENLADHVQLTPICCESESFTTTENMRNAAAEIRRLQFDPKQVKITIYCEAQRSFKVILLSRRLMLPLVKDCDSIEVRTVNWERADPVQELKRILATWIGLQFPWLGIGDREGRLQRQKSKTR